MNKQQCVGILGVGNLLLRDEGFGVHCIRYLEDNYSFPESVRLLDGGTGGIMLTTFLEENQRILVIDTVSMDGQPGTICHFSMREMRGADIGTRLSPHQLGLLETLALCELRNVAPSRIDFFTIIPLDISDGIDLSPLLFSKLPEMSAMVVEKLVMSGYFSALKTITPPHA